MRAPAKVRSCPAHIILKRGVMSKKAAIVGGAGFAGIELVRLLLHHPAFDLCAVTSDAYAGRLISDVYPAFTGRTELAFTANDDVTLTDMDVVFLAVPHTVAMSHAPALVDAGCAVIDLSADFRIKDAQVFERYYGVAHTQPDLLARAAFGQPELFSDGLAAAAREHEAKRGVLVACAGCYPTATSLAAAPAIRSGLLADEGAVVACAISGVTGAGKKASDRTHFCHANENVEAYGLVKHRHTPEIEQILGIEGRLVFTPHLAPLNRGLLSTVNIPICSEARNKPEEFFVDLYRDFYAESLFVSALPQGTTPKTASVVGTNNAQVGVAYNDRAGVLVAVCAIDNLCKGAAGQAVQCANIVFGLAEDAGLTGLALPV